MCTYKNTYFWQLGQDEVDKKQRLLGLVRSSQARSGQVKLLAKETFWWTRNKHYQTTSSKTSNHSKLWNTYYNWNLNSYLYSDFCHYLRLTVFRSSQENAVSHTTPNQWHPSPRKPSSIRARMVHEAFVRWEACTEFVAFFFRIWGLPTKRGNDNGTHRRVQCIRHGSHRGCLRRVFVFVHRLGLCSPIYNGTYSWNWSVGKCRTRMVLTRIWLKRKKYLETKNRK